MQNETVTNPPNLANQVDDFPTLTLFRHRILLLGASIRWAAQSASRHYPVVGMDLFGDQDTHEACHRFRRISPLEQSDRPRLQLAAERFARQENAFPLRVGGLPPEPKLSLRQTESLAHQFGFSFPETHTTEEFFTPRNNHLQSAVRQQPSRWLLKQAESSGGLGVQTRKSIDIDRPPANAFLQRRVDGRSYGLVAFSAGSTVRLLGITRSTHVRIGSLPFVYAGSRSISFEEYPDFDRMQSLAHAVAETRQLHGLFNLDFIRDRHDRWWLLEVNERPSASCEVIEKIAQHALRPNNSASLMSLHIAAQPTIRKHINVGPSPDRFPPLSNESNPSRAQIVKRIVYSSRGGHVYLSRMQSVETAMQREMDCESSEIQIADRPAEGTPIRRGHPVATLLIASTESSRDIAARVKTLTRAVQSCVAPNEPS
ncbi:ATP-grasp domain-containing protein [Rhodopirellula sallentina]|uniref:Protein containing ATP-grasp fold, DUF201-type n=1 Tax=Rhodopirellula sallentina SM41 TaxID=1263870 RepID=M5UAI5_9BACT|nr:ATP-grasp domain-containing protein [Rhodopirellula sallentina]EMI58435.1 protein containing ATP-grasp fold, DUF201-type [Rhodopirellula sallentina SM41]